ncbi:MAG: response regulator [Bacteriovoracaceae bacterium]|nr:response regulator [Bacteriovoracaceae bacterium]
MNDLNFLQRSFDQAPSAPLVIVEDDNLLGLTLKKFLERTFGLTVKLYTSSEDCLVEFTKNHDPKAPFFLLADISLGQGSDGLLLIDILKERGFTFTSVIMTGFASIETAIAATKRGAFHYLTKPFELEVLKQLVFNGFRERLGIELGALILQRQKRVKIARLVPLVRLCLSSHLSVRLPMICSLVWSEDPLR